MPSATHTTAHATAHATALVHATAHAGGHAVHHAAPVVEEDDILQGLEETIVPVRFDEVCRGRRSTLRRVGTLIFPISVA